MARIIYYPGKRSNKLRHAFSLLFFLIISGTLYAQQFSATIDRDKILLGEQVLLQVTLKQINTSKNFVNDWVNLPDTFNHLEVVKRDLPDTVIVNGLVTYTQQFTITGFDSGTWKIQPFVILKNKATGKEQKLSSDLLQLQVLPVDVSSLEGYHPIKDIIEVDKPTNYLFISIIAAIILVMTYLLYKFIQKKKTVKPLNREEKLKGTPLERALEKLQHLEEENLLNKNAVKLYHAKMDDIYRHYFKERLAINALKITTDELMIRLNVYMQETGLRTNFYQVMRLNNAIKFAKYIPPKDESEAALSVTKKTLINVDGIIQKSLLNAN